MKITISKILNKTDLAESGSHGGLVVTKPMINPLTDFFEETGVDRDFKDKDDGEIFSIHYMDYTSNGTTPNDRVTPIGRFKTKHELKPGDQLILQKIDQNGQKDYFIEYARRLNAAYFVGKSKESVEVLDFEQFTNVIIRKIQEGKVQSITSNDCEMNVRYMGVLGKLTISQTADGFEMYFDGVHIEEKYKYFELDMSVEPFELRKTDSWKLDIELDVNEADTELNDEADQSWDKNKKLVKRSKRRYNMNPWALIWANDRYYLYGYDVKETDGVLNERNYRVDKLDNIQLSDIPREGKSQFRSFNANTYVSRRMGMFSGKEQAITVRIPEALVGAFIDQFGKRITISEDREDLLLVTFNAVPSVILLGWLLGLKSVEVVEPQNVREDIINLLQHNMNFYEEKN